jgi:glutathione S-transferase
MQGENKMQSKPIVGYWNMRGKAQSIRNLLVYMNVYFEDKLHSDHQAWFSKENKELGFDYPNLPYFIDGDLKISESIAIVKYICQKYNHNELLGKTLHDQATLNMLYGAYEDFLEFIIKTLF